MPYRRGKAWHSRIEHPGWSDWKQLKSRTENRIMKTKRIIVFVAALILVQTSQTASAQGTAFTYQGRLTDNGAAANGTYSLRFILYNAEFGGSQVGPTRTNENIVASAGLFTTTLDFGADVFSGSPLWLEVAVRTNGSLAVHQALSPRQPLTPAPYAIFAPNAGTAMSVTGTVTSAVTFNNPANSFNGVHTGSGAGLASLNASQLTSGTVPNARLSGTYGNRLSFTNDLNVFAGDGRDLTALNASELAIGTVPNARLAANVARTNQVWLLGGNAGTTAGTHFLGTTDTNALELRVNNQRALRFQPGDAFAGGTPNIIGGLSSNAVVGNVAGVVIGGGGKLGTNASGLTLVNAVTNSSFATIGGGSGHRIFGFSDGATIGGGNGNSINGGSSTIAGGSANEVISGASDSIGGGLLNRIENGGLSVIAGGYLQDIFDSTFATIGGGYVNNISQADYATIPGGRDNEASADYTFASGRRAKAGHEGAWVWADSANADFASTGTNQFLIRASGGVGIGTNNPASTLHVNGTVRVEGNTTIGALFALSRVTVVPTANSTLTPTNSFLLLNPASSVTLSGTTAIASGATIGSVLILEGTDDSQTVTINNNANTSLAAASRTLGDDDTLMLIWNGANWIEISFSNN
jgi:hypothetical protein